MHVQHHKNSRMPKEKKGQVTFFIIIGIILLISITLFLFIRYETLQDQERETREVAADAPNEFKPVLTFVQQCLEKITSEGISIVARRGGYVDLPTQATQNATMNTAYYFYNNKDISPSVEIVTQELEKYVEAQLPFCFANFADFPYFLITSTPPQAVAIITTGDVQLNVETTIKITKI